MQRRPADAAIFYAPTKILPRVRSGGLLKNIGANLLAYTQRPAVNLTLLVLAGLLLVGLGFVLGAARRESLPGGAPAADQAVPPVLTRTASPAAPAASPANSVNAIAVSSLPIAPPPAREPSAVGRTGTGSSGPAKSPSSDFPLFPDRPPVEGASETKRSNLPPVRNPGF
jgi:hypothetical protein